MTFNSWEFLLFYPLVALLYFVLPKKFCRPMLLIASYFFYMCYRAELVVLIFATTLVSWLSSWAIVKSERKSVRKLWLILTLTVCLGVLFFYKYFDFLSNSATGLLSLFGLSVGTFELNLLLPVGISFYTFQTLSYVIDVYRGDVAPERNFFFYALFVSFFPQLVAGPIERPDNLIPQLRENHAWDHENAVAGFKFMMLGFFKKVVVADGVSAAVTSVYADPASAGGLAILAATVLFAVQIYCDFSGYTDIAIGCSRVMGIRLMKNFDHPYRSTSVKEFWGRWHISLSSWLKDYLYFPLGGSRCSKARHLLNLMIVFLVSGLWHGAAWTFVLWGALHGLYRVVGTLTLPVRNRLLVRMKLDPDGRPVRLVRTAITFVLICFSWMFFRADSVSDLGLLFGGLFGRWNVGFAETLSRMGLDFIGVLTIAFSVAILLMLDSAITYEGENDLSDETMKNGTFAYPVLVIAFAWILLLSVGESSTFIYFQF